MNSFFEKLRERKFVEWVIAYLAGAWLLLQVADFLRENFDWSAVFVRVLTVVLGFGFLAILVIAWYHGARGTQRAPRTEFAVLLGIAGVAAGAAWYVARIEALRAGTDPAALEREESPALLTAFDPATAAGSIAVLPFVNMTPDEQNDYLTDGITEDIIAELGKSTALRVISRTSVMRYRETTKTIGQIGAELGVGAILEGSVRVQGDKVRIVAQLIDVATDAHLWTDTYDRDLKDIFAIQSAVAQDIANALNATLAPAVVAAEERSDGPDPEAYRLYSRGKALAGSDAPADRQNAITYLDSAVQRDPQFAEAYAALASLQTPMTFDAPAAPAAPGVGQKVTEAAEKALQLNPHLADARSAWAMQRALQQGDMVGAEQASRQAVTANPNSVPSRMRYVQILAGRGRMEDAQRELQTVVKLDPMSPMVNAKAGEMALAMGRPDQAEIYLRRSLDLDSASIFPHITLAMLEKDRGNMEVAIEEAEMAVRMAPDDPAALSALGYILGAAGRTTEALRIADRLEVQVREGKAPHSALAQVHFAVGDMKEAVDWLKEGADLPRERIFALMNPRIRAALEALRSDPALGGSVDSLLRRVEFRQRPPEGDSTRRRGLPPPPRTGDPDRR
jgi:TolB-like protein/Flp pilus assembly protein TadD